MKGAKVTNIPNEKALGELYRVGKELRLGDLATICEELEKDAGYFALLGTEQLTMILSRVLHQRKERKNQKLREKCGVDDPTISIHKVRVTSTGLTQQMLTNLRAFSWANPTSGRWLCVTGATGVGKSGLVKSLILDGTSHGLRGFYYDFLKLSHDIEEHLSNKTINAFHAELNQYDILGIDEVGLTKCSEEVVAEFKAILDARIVKKGLIITTQVPPTEWFQENVRREILDAICDRVLARSNIQIKMDGDSQRINPIEEVPAKG